MSTIAYARLTQISEVLFFVPFDLKRSQLPVFLDPAIRMHVWLQVVTVLHACFLFLLDYDAKVSHHQLFLGLSKLLFGTYRAWKLGTKFPLTLNFCGFDDWTVRISTLLAHHMLHAARAFTHVSLNQTHAHAIINIFACAPHNSSMHN